MWQLAEQLGSSLPSILMVPSAALHVHDPPTHRMWTRMPGDSNKVWTHMEDAVMKRAVESVGPVVVTRQSGDRRGVSQSTILTSVPYDESRLPTCTFLIGLPTCTP